jgi:excisionase family DNA binding protein
VADDDLTPREVAAELGVTVRTVQRWIADGRLDARRVGSRVRVSRSSLRAVAEPAREEPQKPFGSVLVANRGEVAARVARTARRMGIRVIGVHAADDRPADRLDEVIPIGSYLDIDELVAAARRSGAEAIHPGYGFLAENPEFARAVTDAGLAWIGPPADAIAAMGDKAAALRGAEARGVPVIPGYAGDAQDDATLAAQAERIGLPLLVKPAAGGGGKGMRLVRRSSELTEALASSRREAHRSFGDDRLVLERYLEGARHVEVQVLFDAGGSGVHLWERDCSSQRRNQKIVEEAPAPSISKGLRARLVGTALEVARSVGYVGAGTVEMLVTDAGDHFFLEMNTRLQVEHPVTEAVTGRDLVEDQLRLAAGATLAQLGLASSPPIHGHAIEARLYAEDPDAGFLPSTGRIGLIVWPGGLRVDTGVAEGDVIGDRYDPMLAKLVAHGATREAALDRLRAGLAGTAVLGVRTNLRFLRWLTDQPSMRDAEMRTDTIAGLALPPAPIPDEDDWLAAATLLAPQRRDPWSDGWRLNAPAIRRVRHGDEERSVAAEPAARDLERAVRIGDVVHVDVDGQSLEFSLAPPPSVEESVRHAAAASESGSASLSAPMPGRVVAVRATAGDVVEADQVVLVIEAMKMEHAVVSPMDGLLAELLVDEGQQVERGDLVAEIRAAPQPPLPSADG